MIRRLSLSLFLSLLAVVPGAVAQTTTVPDVPFYTRTVNIPAGQTVSVDDTLVHTACDPIGTRYEVVVKNGNPGGTNMVVTAITEIDGFDMAGDPIADGAPSFIGDTFDFQPVNTVRLGGTAPAANPAVITMEIWRKTISSAIHSQTYTFPQSTVNKQFTASFAATNLTDRATLVITRKGGLQASDQFTLLLNGNSYRKTKADFTATTQTRVYHVTLQATNTLLVEAVAASQASDVTVKVYRHLADTVAPAIAFTGTVPAVVGTSTYTFNGTVTDARGIASLSLNGETVPVSATNGAFTKAVTLTHGAPNTFTFLAYDCTGKGTQVVKTITWDRDAPVVMVTSPPANSFTRTTLAVDGTATDDTGTRPVVKVNGTTAQYSDATRWRATITLSATPEGPRNITVVATDAAAHSTTVTHPVVLDSTLPTITAAIAPPPTVEGWSPIGATVTFTCNDSASGIQLCTPPEPAIIQAGRYGIKGTAIDRAGNMATLTQPVKGDEWGPALNLTPIGHTTQSTITINDMVTDDGGSGVASVTCNGIAATLGSNQYTCTVPLVAGLNHIRVVATDKVGNEEIEQMDVRLDQEPPLLTVDAPADGAPLSGSEITVSGTATDNYDIFHVKVNGTIIGHANGPFSGTVVLASGSNTITVEANDYAGNLTTRSITVVRDDTPPTITATLNPAPNAAGWQKQAVTLTFACADANGVSQCNAPITTTTEGEHQVTATATDNAGNIGTAEFTVRIDTETPVISSVNEQPLTKEGWATSDVAFHYFCGDKTSGIATCSERVVLLAANGEQTITGTAADKAGNTAETTRTVRFDTSRPVLQVTPLEQVTRNFALPVAGSISDTISGLRSLTCNGAQASIVNGSFQCSVTLARGANQVKVLATDNAGNQTEATQSVFADNAEPRITIAGPADGFVTSEASVRVTGTIVEDDQLAALTVGGVSAAPGAAFDVHVPLADGLNQLVVQATDRAGNVTTATVSVKRFAVPEIAITTPKDLVIIRDATTTVSGTINDPGATVTVNDIPATIANGIFTASGLPLQQGRTVVTASATNSLGRIATATINIYRDSIPPRLSVYSPEDGATVYSSPISVSGMVDDIVVGTINSTQMRVTVNGQAAEVSNRAFLYRNLSLSPGLNTIVITAIDEGGNRTIYSHSVTLAIPVKPKLVLVSGEGQSSSIGSQLAAPVVVQAVSPEGTPLPGVPVKFRIIDNDGMLHSNTASERTLTVITDAAGRASVRWTLGMRAGAGNNRMEVSAPDFAAVIEATAAGHTGTPALIVVDSGNDQFAITGDLLPRPLVAVVVDAGNNRLADIPVTFNAVDGGGTFGDQPSITILTDSDGRAIAHPAAGAEAGEDNNVFTASVAGLAKTAAFRASGRLPGLPAATSITGVVLDNTQIPLAGVSVRIDGTNVLVQTDAQGQFRIQPAPVGYVKLFIDGSTAERAGTWPTLEYALHTLAGTENTVGMPIYLLPIDTARGLFVDDTTGGTLTLPELPGFALKVAPGSVTFPGGGRTGTVSATLVHADRIPMAPGFGQQPQFIVTIQPVGTHFDPPAQLSFPNVDGLAPGEISEMYSFDHDLAQFVAIGTATVSADGTILTSDPGVGIIKGGWHCGGNPTVSGDCGGGGCEQLEGGVEGECKGPIACKTYLCEDGECIAHDPFELKAKYVDRDDASRGWSSEQDLEDYSALFGNYGGSSVYTADYVRFYAKPAKEEKEGVYYEWKATGPETITGPAGWNDAAKEWKIEGLKWKPGKYVVELHVTFRGTCTDMLRFRVIVGIRTGEYVAFGAILRQDFPPDLHVSFPFWLAEECPFIALELLLNSREWPREEKEPTPEPYAGLTHDERRYALYRIIQTTSDEEAYPRASGSPEDHFGLSSDRNYRFFVRAQFKYFVENGQFLGAPMPVGRNVAVAGETTAPCGLSWLGPNPNGLDHPENGRGYIDSDGSWVYQVLTRAGAVDQLGYEHLVHRKLPWVVARLRFHPDSPDLQSNFERPSRDWETKDGADFSLVPTIKFFHRYFDGLWIMDQIARTDQKLEEFTALGPPAVGEPYLP
jgi:hypothetical protein